jgi:hypothetical protein
MAMLLHHLQALHAQDSFQYTALRQEDIPHPWEMMKISPARDAPAILHEN